MLSVPITSEIREVPVLSIRAMPIPCRAAQGKTIHFTHELSRNASGTDAMVVTTNAIIIGTSLLANFYVILACKNNEKTSEKM